MKRLERTKFVSITGFTCSTEDFGIGGGTQTGCVGPSWQCVSATTELRRSDGGVFTRSTGCFCVCDGTENEVCAIDNDRRGCIYDPG
jgi:hypothetical protein